jgi:hypothetical protein
MNTLELCCLAVVGLWVVLRFAREPAASRAALAGRMAVVAVAAWLAEDSCIRLYGFYGYSRTAWRVFVDQVPLLVLLIWPVVVTSALDLARALRLRTARLPAALGVLVVTDAWFIEPIAVDAGLWSWTESGPFAVPTIGVLGWGCFAAGVGLALSRGWPVVAALVTGPLVCHALVLALWWGAFRWLPDTPHPWLHPAAAWLVALALVVAVARARPDGLRGLVWLRAPAAVFFFSLLWLHGRDDDDASLLAWSLAFAPPWLALLTWSTSTTTTAEPTTSGGAGAGGG